MARKLNTDQILALLALTAPEAINAIGGVAESEDLQALEVAEAKGRNRKTVLKAVGKALKKNPPEDRKGHAKAVRVARQAGKDKRMKSEPKCKPWDHIQDGVDALIVDASQRDTLATGLDKADHVLDKVTGHDGVLDRALTFPSTPGGAVAEALTDAALMVFRQALRGLFRSYVQNRYDALKADGRL